VTDTSHFTAVLATCHSA